MGLRPLSGQDQDRKSTRLNSSHSSISYAVFCLKKKFPCPHHQFGPQNPGPSHTGSWESHTFDVVAYVRPAGSASAHAGKYTTEQIFFFNDTATTEIYTLSLHDALPI